MQELTKSMIADCSVRRILRRQPLHESISYPNVSPTHEAATEPIRHPDLQRQWDSIGAAPYRHSPEPIRHPESTVYHPRLYCDVIAGIPPPFYAQSCPPPQVCSRG